MNPSDYDFYDSPPAAAMRYTCRACDPRRFCVVTVLDGSTPMACPCGECPEWRGVPASDPPKQYTARVRLRH